jgi:hypothetical protein
VSRRGVFFVAVLLWALPIAPALADGGRKFEIVARTDQGGLESRPAELKDLLSDRSFDGLYFRIVKGAGNEPIPFDGTDPKVLLHAATAYHYLTLAREAYRGILGDQPQLRTRMTIRIDQDRDFSEVSHFTSVPVRNGALSIDASDPRDALDGLSWDPEIWFFVSQKVRFAAGEGLGSMLNSPEFKLQLLLGLLEQDVSAASRDVLSNRFYFEPHLYSVALSFGIAELLPIVLEQVVKRIKTTVFVDTALIPEIIVHEYGHHALGPWFGFKQRTHLVEGYPNYFAGRILGLSRLQAHARPYSSGFAPRRGDSGAGYSLQEEYGSSAATSSFTFSLLNDLEDALGPKGPAVLVRALDYIDRSSTLKPDFENAVMRAVSEIIPGSPSALRKAGEVFAKRGM